MSDLTIYQYLFYRNFLTVEILKSLISIGFISQFLSRESQYPFQLQHESIPYLKCSLLQVSWNNPLTQILRWKMQLALRSKCSGAHYSNQAMLARSHVLPDKMSDFKVQSFTVSSQSSVHREYLCFLRFLLLHGMLWQKAYSKHLNILLVFSNPTLAPVYTNRGECGICIIGL